MKGAASSGVGGAAASAAPGFGETRGIEHGRAPEPDVIAQNGTARFLPGAGPVPVRVPDAIDRLRRGAGRQTAMLRRRMAAAHGVLRAGWSPRR
jgi:hypothetical protein